MISLYLISLQLFQKQQQSQSCVRTIIQNDGTIQYCAKNTDAVPNTVTFTFAPITGQGSLFLYGSVLQKFMSNITVEQASGRDFSLISLSSSLQVLDCDLSLDIKAGNTVSAFLTSGFFSIYSTQLRMTVKASVIAGLCVNGHQNMTIMSSILIYNLSSENSGFLLSKTLSTSFYVNDSTINLSGSFQRFFLIQTGVNLQMIFEWLVVCAEAYFDLCERGDCVLLGQIDYCYVDFVVEAATVTVSGDVTQVTSAVAFTTDLNNVKIILSDSLVLPGSEFSLTLTQRDFLNWEVSANTVQIPVSGSFCIFSVDQGLSYTNTKINLQNVNNDGSLTLVQKKAKDTQLMKCEININLKKDGQFTLLQSAVEDTSMVMYQTTFYGTYHSTAASGLGILSMNSMSSFTIQKVRVDVDKFQVGDSSSLFMCTAIGPTFNSVIDILGVSIKIAGEMSIGPSWGFGLIGYSVDGLNMVIKQVEVFIDSVTISSNDAVFALFNVLFNNSLQLSEICMWTKVATSNANVYFIFSLGQRQYVNNLTNIELFTQIQAGQTGLMSLLTGQIKITNTIFNSINTDSQAGVFKMALNSILTISNLNQTQTDYCQIGQALYQSVQNSTITLSNTTIRDLNVTVSQATTCALYFGSLDNSTIQLNNATVSNLNMGTKIRAVLADQVHNSVFTAQSVQVSALNFTMSGITGGILINQQTGTGQINFNKLIFSTVFLNQGPFVKDVGAIISRQISSQFTVVNSQFQVRRWINALTVAITTVNTGTLGFSGVTFDAGLISCGVSASGVSGCV
ncbi:Hypothetical_protein [Hexamita inflata]|uniref:Hypothetical_protein n=1 Tax=Hexamita inflata TaxID=28002 RepID=A0AA86NMK1_9EUKA|nr:Hypothetical protein HINF_LOCUS9969 [Hexamita inflata]